MLYCLYSISLDHILIILGHIFLLCSILLLKATPQNCDLNIHFPKTTASYGS